MGSEFRIDRILGKVIILCFSTQKGQSNIYRLVMSFTNCITDRDSLTMSR